MRLKGNCLYLSLIILCIASFSGCKSLFFDTKAEQVGPAEQENYIEAKENIVKKENTVNDEIIIDEENEENIVDEEYAVNEESGADLPDASSEEVTYYDPDIYAEQAISSIEDTTIDQTIDESVETVAPTNQELIDGALEYCQTANNFLEQGDADSAIDALDKAYSYILKVDGSDNPDLLQQREDLRWTISKRIIEVYSTRFTVINGNYTAIPLDMNSHVQRAIDYFKSKDGKKFFLESYARSGKYRPAIVEALKEAGFPEELSWLPLIESGFKVRAQSSARALGLWQFIASTGYKYGLKRDTWIDERMDPEKSTAAAIAYLSDLHHIFGDWKTVLAAYNCGEKRVLNEINKQKISYLDDFWDLFLSLPYETAFYVPKFLAVLYILQDPESYGFELTPLEEEIQHEEVTVNKQLNLDTIAKCLDIDKDIIKELNPELRQNATPKSAYSLKVPSGKGEILLAKIDELPVYYPVVADYNTIHRVRSGETLSGIAQRYRTSISTIMKLNNIRNPNFVRAGTRLKITSQGTVAASSLSGSGGESTRYIVKKGDSLYKIARRYNTTVQTLKVLNGLSTTVLQVGQELIISSNISTASKDFPTQMHIVKKGENPYVIAKKYNMNLYDFLNINDLSPGSTIFPGQEVRVSME